MNRKRMLTIAAGVVTMLFIAIVAVWWFLLRSNAPPPVSLEEAAAAVTSSTTTQAGASETTTSSAVDLDGPWATVGDNGSLAGYRVEEELARVGFTTAAGRTEDVEASLSITGSTVTAVDVLINMQTLESDDNRRDGAIRNQALETNAFATATFALTEPIGLPDEAATGTAFSVQASGDLTLHGVTRSVTFTLEAQLIDDVIAVIGSAPILFADYDIDPPSALAVLSVDDHGEMEFQLLFEQ